MNCVFCKIMDGSIPSYTVYEDSLVKVFLDINPDVNGHLLIVPKKHTLDLTSIEDDLLIHIMGIARKMQELLEKKLNIDGLTLIQNNGCVQEVKHYHLHLKPFYKDNKALTKPEEIFDILKK